MEDAQEQMDIDIAINDIKQLRQGFISYVNDQGEPAAEEDLEQIDDFLDPSKFIERHFGEENPDIIFQEVITQVPELPIAAETATNEFDPQGEEEIYEDQLANAQVLQNEQDDMQADEQFNDISGVQPALGGFTEENVTPQVIEDMWDTNNNGYGVADKAKGSNLITGETFLKDARQIDQSIEDMNVISKKVNGLSQPYNDNQMTQQQTFNSNDNNGNQTINLAIESQMALNSEIAADYESQQQIDREGGAFDDEAIKIRDVQSENNIAEIDDSYYKDAIEQQQILAVNQGQDTTISKQGSTKGNIEVNITKKRRGKDAKFDSIKSAQNKRKPIKVLRMADYFKPSMAALSAHNISGATTADEKETHRDQSQILEDLETAANDKRLKKELDAKLEQDILDNVGVNFIFNKGTGLTSGLIDQDRIFSVMNKLKELAYKQLQSGSNQINYQEIVAYLKDSEGFFSDEIVDKEDRNKLYIGEAIVNNEDSFDQKQESVQQIAEQPALIGLENEDEEKNRRWGQCINFLRNNPKLLMQMIPNDLDDIDSGVTLVGKPRPVKRKGSKPPKIVKSHPATDQARQFAKPRFLAMSEDQRSGPAVRIRGKQPTKQIAQKPIKIRPHAVRDHVFYDKKFASEQENQPLEIGDDLIVEQNEGPQSDCQEEVNLQREYVDETLNIDDQTTEIRNPSNMALGPRPLQPIAPGTTKCDQPARILLEGFQNDDGNILLDVKSTNITRQTRQQSAVIRPTAGKNNAIYQRLQGELPLVLQSSVSADIRKKISLQTKISAMRGFSGKDGREGGVSYGKPHGWQRGEMGNTSMTTPSGVTTAMHRNWVSQSRGLKNAKFASQNNFTSSMLRGPGLDHERNTQNRAFNGYKSGFPTQKMSRVFSGTLGLQATQKRPTTAVCGPSLTQAHGVGRRRLASNSILQVNARNRSSNRGFAYSKQNYQTSGGLVRVTSTVRAELQVRKTLHEGGDQISGPEGPTRMQSSEMVDENLAEFQPEREQAVSAIGPNGLIPSIFRQSNELSALSNIGQDGQYFYYDGTVSQPEQPKITAEVAIQTSNDEPQNNSKRTIEVQTEIQDVRGDLSPLPKGQDRSLQSHLGLALQNHTDWAYTPLCAAVLNKKTTFNHRMEKRVFVEAEVDVVLQMLKSKFQEFSQTDILAPYHAKALETLKELLHEQGLAQLVRRFEKQYLEITIENTLKLLLRSKLVFSARLLFIEIFDKILRYEVASQDAKKMLETKDTYKLPLQELNELRLKCGRMYEAGEKVLLEIRQLRADRKGHYSQPFIFKKKDLTQKIKNEIAEVRQLLKVYRVKRRSDSQNSDKPARFVVVTDDEVSEREEVRDSNYVGTDLYWENRFYQIKPFKQPEESNDFDTKIFPGTSEEMKDGVLSDDINDKEFLMI